MASTTNNSDGGGGGLNKPPQIAATATAPPPALNPVTLSKALAKPPPLSSILNNRSPLLSNQQNGPATTTTTSSISTNGPTHSQLPVASVALNGPSVGHANGLASIAATATTSHLFDQSTTSVAASSIARVPTPQQLQQQQLPKLVSLCFLARFFIHIKYVFLCTSVLFIFDRLFYCLILVSFFNWLSVNKFMYITIKFDHYRFFVSP